MEIKINTNQGRIIKKSTIKEMKKIKENKQKKRRNKIVIKNKINASK